MQDIHSIGGGGGGGRLFGGGGDNRRLRPQQSHQSNQALKCPRCDSANTKFCYYNNYNLSQPRHFCKSCRRYWTKGGVLRNVPVGGGCRKAKRSKTTKASSSSDAPRKEKKSSSNSSSENSSLTASNTAATTTASTAATGGAATEIGSGSCSTSASTLLNFPSSVFFNIPQSTSLSFDPPSLIDHPPEGRMFPEIGSFTSMMTSANDHSQIGFDVADGSGPAYRINQEPDPEDPNQQKITSTLAMVEEEMKLQGVGGGITNGFLNQTAEIDLSGMQSRGSNGGLGALDWQGGTDQGIFDLSGTVDQAYWSQSQWTDNDQSLYLP